MRSLNKQRGYKQRGYAALLLLAGLSAATLGFGMVGSKASRSQWQILTQDAFQLNSERARLIHYAVDYSNLYESGGAGPGHLPCPDTDPGFVRPGPNPPCGRDALATGKLPDGVTREVGRIALTDSLLNRSSYAVSRGLVNNPSLAVHALDWPAQYVFDSHAVGYVKLSRPSGQSRTLTQQQLHKPTLNWVRAWLVWQLLESSLNYCQKHSSNQSLDRASFEPGSGQSFSHLNTEDLIVGFCPQSSDNNVQPILVDPALVASQALALCESASTPCTFSDESALAWLVEPGAEHWEGSQIQHHWFVENQWLDLFQLRTRATCIHRTEDCVLSIDVKDDRLTFRLSPSVQVLDDG